MATFRQKVTIRFEEADARGILFYGRLQTIAHHVFEDFVVSELVPTWDAWFLNDSVMTPIRHAEATYHRPMLPGHQYEARLSLTHIGESSFEIWTQFVDLTADAPVVCAETRVVKVFADPAKMKKIPIPSAIRSRLEAYLADE